MRGTTVRMWGHGRAHAHARVRAHAGVVRARPRTRAHRKYRLAEDVAASEAANQAAAVAGREHTRAT